MANNDGIISELSQRVYADVAEILGEKTTKVSELCTSDKINWASIFKPVHIANTPKPDRSGEWWRGTYMDCGIKPKYMNIYSDAPDAMTSDHKNGWTYQRPWGGDISPFRIADFMKYNHYAIFPIRSWNLSSQATRDGYVLAQLMNVQGSNESPTEPGSLTLNDIIAQGLKLSEWKFGIFVTDINGNRRGRVVGDSIGGCQFDCSSLVENQSYIAYPFLAMYPMGQKDQDIANGYISVPYCAPQTFKVVSSDEYYGVNIDLSGTQTGSRIRYVLKVTVSSGTLDVTGGSLHCRFSTSAQNSGFLVGETSIAIEACTITRTAPLNKQGWCDGDSSRNFRLDLRLNTRSGTFTKSIFVMNNQIDPPIEIL